MPKQHNIKCVRKQNENEISEIRTKGQVNYPTPHAKAGETRTQFHLPLRNPFACLDSLEQELIPEKSNYKSITMLSAEEVINDKQSEVSSASFKTATATAMEDGTTQTEESATGPNEKITQAVVAAVKAQQPRQKDAESEVGTAS